jgi:hypothetical protein
MNKHLLWLPVILTVGAAVYNPVKEAKAPKTENKNISFAIYKRSDYKSTVYNSSTAQVHITVEKVDNKGMRTAVWDSTMNPKSLSQYPSIDQVVPESVVIPHINKKREHLEVSYTLIYNSDGNELQMQGDQVISDTTSNVSIKI